ncbi:MAG: hypothetical protein GX901_06985 [Lentisphaerae bacterium]|nr:hypothetical protein [Lentisphaerota bacterium]
MAKPGPRVIISKDELKKAKKIIADLPYRNDILIAFTVILTSLEKLSQAIIADTLGVSESTVKRMIKDFKKKTSTEDETDTPTWGGDRRSILTREEEIEVLEQMTPEAVQGRFVTVADIHQALEAKAGRKLSKQTAYNTLYRHNWQKVALDKAHLKNEAENLEQFKKIRSLTRYTWQPSSPSWREKTFA